MVPLLFALLITDDSIFSHNTNSESQINSAIRNYSKCIFVCFWYCAVVSCFVFLKFTCNYYMEPKVIVLMLCQRTFNLLKKALSKTISDKTGKIKHFLNVWTLAKLFMNGIHLMLISNIKYSNRNVLTQSKTKYQKLKKVSPLKSKACIKTDILWVSLFNWSDNMQQYIIVQSSFVLLSCHLLITFTG